MNAKQEQPPNARIDYHWRVDREDGFDQASLLYDANGRLRAVDYQPRRESDRERANRATRPAR